MGDVVSFLSLLQHHLLLDLFLPTIHNLACQEVYFHLSSSFVKDGLAQGKKEDDKNKPSGMQYQEVSSYVLPFYSEILDTSCSILVALSPKQK